MAPSHAASDLRSFFLFFPLSPLFLNLRLLSFEIRSRSARLLLGAEIERRLDLQEGQAVIMSRRAARGLQAIACFLSPAPLPLPLPLFPQTAACVQERAATIPRRFHRGYGAE